MSRKSSREPITENASTDWNPQNRRPLFKTLKRGQQVNNDSTNSKHRSKYSPKSTLQRENQKTDNKSPHETTACYNAATEDLFQRSVFSLEHRTHRANLIPDPEKPNDIIYSHPQKKIKNYKPLTERYMESAENKKNVCNKYVEERKAKERDECTFTPKIVSKQTTHDHDLFRGAKKIPQEEEQTNSPVINPKSKEIADRLVNSTTIYSRQSAKIYHNIKTPNENTAKTLKMPQKEIDNLIDRLTYQQQDSSSDSSEFDDKFRNTKIDKKDIERLLLDSVYKNQSRSICRTDSNPYKPKLNEKSVKLAKNLAPKPRDLYKESLIELENKERKATILKNYREMQEMQDCIPFPKTSQNPSYLNKVNEVNLNNVRDKRESNEIRPFESYIYKEINPKPFSFDKASKKRKNE